MRTEIKVYIDIEPLSVNSTYYNNKNHGMNSNAKSWFNSFLYQLKQYSNAFTEMQEAFKDTQHVYCVEIQVLTPTHKLLTKEGKYTSKKVDLSNLEKSIIDALFLPKHNAHTPNLNVDDRYLQRLTSELIETTGKSGLLIRIYQINKPLPVKIEIA